MTDYGRIYDRKKCDLPPRLDPFPFIHQSSAARAVVHYHVALTKCPAADRGPKSDALWRGMLATFGMPESGRPRPDIPAIKAWMRERFAREMAEALRPPGGWCEEAKYLYGELGNKQPNAIVMREGSDSTAKCVLNGSCSAANTLEFDMY